MDYITGLTRGGTPWVPSFLVSLDHRKCIGCGRCYKTCTRDVLTLIERSEVDDDDEDNDDVTMVMSLKNPHDCIGCESCARVCPKQAMVHAPQAVG